jgi:hypothetical protein
MASRAAAGEVGRGDWLPFAEVEDAGGAVDMDVEAGLAGDLVEEDGQGVSLEVQGDRAGLPDDDGVVRYREVDPALIAEA